MKTILVPTDFSAPAQNALDYASGLAREFNLKLILLNSYSYVINSTDPLQNAQLMMEPETNSVKGLEAIKQQLMAEKGIQDVVCLSKLGLPTDHIIETCKHYNVDAIVMGITGEAGVIKEKVIGSTTLDIARDVSTPLFIIPEGVSYKKIEILSFACDIYNLQGSAVLDHIKEVCKQLKCGLEVVNVEKPEHEDPPIRLRNTNFMESNLNDIKHKTIVLQEDDNHQTLQNYFKEKQPDIIALNPKKQKLIQSLFHKSMTKSMMFHVKAPMLIVH